MGAQPEGCEDVKRMGISMGSSYFGGDVREAFESMGCSSMGSSERYYRARQSRSPSSLPPMNFFDPETEQRMKEMFEKLKRGENPEGKSGPVQDYPG